MSLLIVTSRYLKSGDKRAESKRRNYTKYIASREGAEIRDQTKMDLEAAPTEKQNQLLKELIKDFPESRNYLEYEDFTSNPTIENISELISTIIERNADVIGNRQNFVGYMALRPGAEKRGAHGLFNGSDEPIVLKKASEEVAHHPGNVWSHVISLRREDAVRLGYDNSDMWRELVKRHIADIAVAQKIQLANMKWYASFHNTTHHPHIHLIVYSVNSKEGYLTKEGINKIRSVFANDIFRDDLQSIYQEQTFTRDDLKRISEDQISGIIEQIKNNEFYDPKLEKLVRQLHSQLKTVSGKKVYKYLPKEVKQTVNEVFSKLAQNEHIERLYEKWCDLERLKYKTYTLQEKELPSLVENKVFNPVRNMIIKTIAEIRLDFPAAGTETAIKENEDVIDRSFNEESVITLPKTKAKNIYPDIQSMTEKASFHEDDGEALDREQAYNEIYRPENSGNEYTQDLIDSAKKYEEMMLANSALGLLINLSRLISDDYEKEHRKLKSQVDKKLMGIINKKKHELGIKAKGLEM